MDRYYTYSLGHQATRGQNLPGVSNDWISRRILKLNRIHLQQRPLTVSCTWSEHFSLTYCKTVDFSTVFIIHISRGYSPGMFFFLLTESQGVCRDLILAATSITSTYCAFSFLIIPLHPRQLSFWNFTI